MFLCYIIAVSSTFYLELLVDKAFNRHDVCCHVMVQWHTNGAFAPEPPPKSLKRTDLYSKVALPRTGMSDLKRFNLQIEWSSC